MTEDEQNVVDRITGGKPIPLVARLLWAILTNQTDIDVSLNSKKLTSLADPTLDQDAATKKYADDTIDTDIATHTAIASAHHTRYADSEALAAAVQAGAITDGVTKAPTHDAVYDVKVTADAALPASQKAAASGVASLNASSLVVQKPADRLSKANFEITLNKLLKGAGAGADPTEIDVPSGGAGGLAIFGDGNDGDVTIAADAPLTRDMFYNNLTVNTTKVLTTAGYRIFVKETLTNNGTISRKGNDGSNGVAGGGGAGGSALATTSLGGSGAGGKGMTDVDTTTYRNAGGGGSGGGIALIVAKAIINSSGIITVAGGEGGNGATAINTGGSDPSVAGSNSGHGGGGGAGGGGGGTVNGAQGGGGGGGGGGCLFIIYNSASWGTESAAGGAAGTGTAPAAVAGSGGTIIKIQN